MRPRNGVDRPWPVWKDRLPPSAGPRPEGGLRLQRASVRPRIPGQPLVSYVTVVRNGARTLERTLHSVRQQTWGQVEHIVVDGQSTDGTLALVEQHAASIEYYASEPDGGLYEALNKAIELAAGDLICVLNADDWLTPEAAAIAVRRHLAGPPRSDKLVLTSALAEGGQRTKLWLPATVDAASVLTCANVCHNAVYATPAAYEASGPYRSTLRIAADFAWLVDCHRAGVAFDYDEQPTLHYSMGGMSSDTRHHAQECQQVLQANFPALSDTEAWGLLHCFHIFQHNLVPFAATRPPHHGRFLHELAQRHARDPAFMQALALAAVQLMRHPADTHAAGKPTRLEKFRRSLHKRAVRLRALAATLPWRR